MTKLPAELIGNIRDLSVSFGRQVVIRSASLAIRRHCIHVISGPSGSGKTSLLRSINRLNDCFMPCYYGGEILLSYDGRTQDVLALPENALPQLRRKVAMVFQNPNVLPGSIAVNLLLPLRVVCQTKGDAAREKLEQALKRVHLWREVKDRLNKPASSLSGGQQQRLCLARALAMDSELLLLDEPTSSLDPGIARQVEELILELTHSYTIVMVSHSERQTRQLADVHIRMEDGRVV